MRRLFRVHVGQLTKAIYYLPVTELIVFGLGLADIGSLEDVAFGREMCATGLRGRLMSGKMGEADFRPLSAFGSMRLEV